MPLGTRAMLVPLGLLLLLLAVGGRCEDTVAANVGIHTVSRMAELLTPAECRQLREQLRGPDRDLDERELELLSEENNPIGEPPRPRRHRRDLGGPKRCSEALREWLRTAGEVTTWDRLTRALRQIGRSDIALELAKNLNQDRRLELRKAVEENGWDGRRHRSAPLQRGQKPQGARSRRAPQGDLGDLRFERRPPPPYTRSPLDWVPLVIAGILAGFLGSVFFTVVTVYSCSWLLVLDT